MADSIDLGIAQSAPHLARERRLEARIRELEEALRKAPDKHELDAAQKAHQGANPTFSPRDCMHLALKDAFEERARKARGEET